MQHLSSEKGEKRHTTGSSVPEWLREQTVESDGLNLNSGFDAY